MNILIIESRDFMFRDMKEVFLEHGLNVADIHRAHSRDGAVKRIRHNCQILGTKIDMIVLDTTLYLHNEKFMDNVDDRGVYVLDSLNLLSKSGIPSLEHLSNVPVLLVSPDSEDSAFMELHPNVKKWVTYHNPDWNYDSRNWDVLLNQ